MISLKQLRYFEALAQTRHFGQAAQRCAVTQPALSMAIRDLERELGVVLAERRGSGVVLTPAGEEVAGRAGRILGEVGALRDFAKAQGGVLIGPLRLGLIPSVAPYLLAGLLDRAREGAPALELLVRESQTGTLLAELQRGELDAIVAALPLAGADVAARPLFEDRFRLAVPAAAAADWAGSDMVERMAGERLLLLEEGHCLRDQALQFCGLADMQARRALGSASLTTILQMVAAGHGITLLPELCLPVEVDPARIAALPFPDDPPRRVIGLAWRRRSGRTRDFEALGRLIAAAAGAAPAGDADRPIPQS